MKGLYPGALGPDWQDPEPAPDPVPMASGGPIRQDAHPADVAPGLYDRGPDVGGDDVQSRLAETRDRYRYGGPHVIVRVECRVCGRGGTFYGRGDDAPDPATFRCDRYTDGGMDDAA